MAMQEQSTAPSRNLSTDAKPGIVPAPNVANSTKAPNNNDGPVDGPAQRGFSGSGVIPGMIKI